MMNATAGSDGALGPEDVANIEPVDTKEKSKSLRGRLVSLEFQGWWTVNVERMTR
jgi:hypothetical protein